MDELVLGIPYVLKEGGPHSSTKARKRVLTAKEKCLIDGGIWVRFVEGGKANMDWFADNYRIATPLEILRIRASECSK